VRHPDHIKEYEKHFDYEAFAISVALVFVFTWCVLYLFDIMPTHS